MSSESKREEVSNILVAAAYDAALLKLQSTVEEVATGCCLAFLKSRKAKNQKLTKNPLH